MIKLFNKIRQNLLASGQTSRYLKYAVGEIILVVIGILIALSINNWNENRKSNQTAREVYQNLLTSLKQDSIEVRDIIALQNRSIETIRKIVLAPPSQPLYELEGFDFNGVSADICLSGMSFFPKTGIYNLLVSSNGLELISSPEIKALLINLYDFQYKKYENLDAIIDQRYQFQLGALMRKKIDFIIEYNPDIVIVKEADPVLFIEHYAELTSECKDMYGVLTTGRNYLVQIQNSINELLALMNKELKS